MSAIGAAVGGIASGVGSFFGGERANSAAKDSAIQQEIFQDHESSTAYQRGVKDMQAAGINPMLAATVGGATSPSGAMAPVVNSLGNAMEAGVNNFSAIQSAMQQAAQVDNVKASTAKTVADTVKTVADTKKVEAGSLLSDVIGADAAKRVSNVTNSAGDVFHGELSGPFAKIADLIDGIRGNSATALEGLSKSASTPLFKAAAHNLAGLLSGRGMPSSAASSYGPPSPFINDSTRDFLANGGM